MEEAANKSGFCYLTFRRHAKKLGVWNPCLQPKRSKDKANLQDYISGKVYGKCSHLKENLYKYGIKHNQCETCKITEWHGLPLVCELDHIDGDTSNNRLDNLRILCPNCHSQTPTFRAKNKNKGHHD
jgi:Zn finger protein HypA/HybF involved in hydrogenase expression